MPMTVLIVDDSPLIRKSVRSCIEQNPEWNVCGEAENGQIAVEKAQDLNPDVVVLDWQMPVMNGLEAARLINQLSPRTSIVIYTFHTSRQLYDRATELRISHVLSKTGGIGALMEALRTICDRPLEGLAGAG